MRIEVCRVERSYPCDDCRGDDSFGIGSQARRPCRCSLRARTAFRLKGSSRPLKKRHGKAVAKIERLVEAVANGAEDFVEIRDVLAKAPTDRDRLAEQLSQLQQVPSVVLHPAIVTNYRCQVAKLNAALGDNPEAR